MTNPQPEESGTAACQRKALLITMKQFSTWCDDYTEAQLSALFATRAYLTPLDVMDMEESISTRLWALRKALPLDARREICTRGVALVIPHVAPRVNDPVLSAGLIAIRDYVRDDGYVDSQFGAAARGLRAYARRTWGAGTAAQRMTTALTWAAAGLLWRTHQHARDALRRAPAAAYKTFDADYERIVREVIVQRGL